MGCAGAWWGGGRGPGPSPTSGRFALGGAGRNGLSIPRLEGAFLTNLPTTLVARVSDVSGGFSES